MRILSLTAALLAAVLATACGDKRLPPGEPVAEVDGTTIIEPQLTFVLAQRNLRPAQAEAAGRQVLERIVDQQLAAAKAGELQLDREPRVQLALDAARREVLARAYLERLGEAAPKPTAEEIQAYYDSKPALFRQRRIYTLQEITVEADAAQQAALREALSAAPTVNAFVEHLKAGGLRYSAAQAVRAAEQLPLPALERLAGLRDGQAGVVPHPNGLQVVVLAGSREQPVSLEQARPAIEQYLLAERRRKLAEEDLRALRAAARIEYRGKYAGGGAAAAAASAASD